MAVTGVLLSGFSPISSYPRRLTLNPIPWGSKRTERVSATRYETAPSSVPLPGSFNKKNDEVKEAATMRTENPYANPDQAQPDDINSLKDYFEEVGDFLRSDGGGDAGPPRWLSPVECGASAPGSPLLLSLPGIDGTGLGLSRHHRRLGKIFDVWCLHIPVMDRTPFQELVKLIERTVRSERHRCPDRPIYIVGEFFGACLALDVAARNPDIDLVLILANTATPLGSAMLQPLLSLLEVMPDELSISVQHMLSFKAGDSLRMVTDVFMKGFPLQQIGVALPEDLIAMSSYLSILVGVFPKETVLWKLRMLKSASVSANSRLHAVKAQTLILSSERDQWMPSQKEADRLHHTLPNSEIRRFKENGHFLFLEDGIDLVTIIKAASFYRRRKYRDYVSDYIPPTPFEFKKASEKDRLLMDATSPVLLSTLEDGKVVKGGAGIPLEGPVLYVGYHMLLGFDLGPLLILLLKDCNVLLRGMAHPLMFIHKKGSKFPEIQEYDKYRLMGAVPVSANNLYRLLASKSHVLLYPGGAREALHRKGEEYKLFWPEHSEFVRMAAIFGAKIVPFGSVGEDDVGELILDYNDQMKIPYLKNLIEETTAEVANLRTGEAGEVGNQAMYLPWVLPKVPGRLYFYFGKPIETAGRKQELRDRGKAQEVYLEVKSEVEGCIEYLKEKRERDPYRSLFSRLQYQALHGFSSEIPTFDL